MLKEEGEEWCFNEGCSIPDDARMYIETKE
jgi:hypothetical protein